MEVYDLAALPAPIERLSHALKILGVRGQSPQSALARRRSPLKTRNTRFLFPVGSCWVDTIVQDYEHPDRDERYFPAASAAGRNRRARKESHGSDSCRGHGALPPCQGEEWFFDSQPVVSAWRRQPPANVWETLSGCADRRLRCENRRTKTGSNRSRTEFSLWAAHHAPLVTRLSSAAQRRSRTPNTPLQRRAGQFAACSGARPMRR